MKSIVSPYFPVFIFMVLAFGLSFVMIALALLVQYKRRKNNTALKEKLSPYECGFEAFDLPRENARHLFDVRFYLVAILFIIFDIEIAFLFPWAVSLKQIGWVGFGSMMIFLGVLTLGFVYEWKKGGLDWE